jgi:ABC-type Co2+ transport system permease subunit
MPLLAVHIAEGVLPLDWIIGGFTLAAVLVAVGARRLTDTEIPRVALFTAAFFVASLIHVPVGLTSVHLLLNGLVGVILGWRSGLAIAVGLFLQAVLVGHGGISSLGVNACVITLPALLGFVAFGALKRVSLHAHPLGRAGLVFGVVVLWGLSLLVGVESVWASRRDELKDWLTHPAGWWSLAPFTLVILGLVAILAAWWERRLENAPDFPLGLLIGEVAVLLAVALNALVLGLAVPGAETVAAVLFVAHLPLAALEGVVCGFTVSFLARVAPQFLASGPAASGVEREQLVERNLPLPEADADHG